MVNRRSRRNSRRRRRRRRQGGRVRTRGSLRAAQKSYRRHRSNSPNLGVSCRLLLVQFSSEAKNVRILGC